MISSFSLKRMGVSLIVSGVLGWVLAFPPSAGAFSERHAVRSESMESETEAAATRAWRMEIRRDSEGAESLTLFPEDSDQPICAILREAPPGRGASVEFSVPGRPPEYGEEGIVILSGFPAPCDVLPRHQAGNDETYETRSVAGGRTFVRRYRVIRERISSEAARKNGWIESSRSMDDGESLRVWTVADGRGNILKKEIWKENDALWLYEETPYRRSWRLD